MNSQHFMESDTSLSFSQARHYFPQGATAPSGPGPPHYRGFTITLRHTTLGRTPLDERSARRRDIYLTTHNTHKKETSMPPAGFEPAIPASERPQNHALDSAATRTGSQPLSSAELGQSAHSYSFSVITVVMRFSFINLSFRFGIRRVCQKSGRNRS